MPNTVVQLERKRAKVLEGLSQLGYFRAGSITALVRRCGRLVCRCSQPDDPGHGPNLRMTYKINGKTYSESLPSQEAVRKAQSEIAEFRKFQRLSRDFIRINAMICRLRSSGAR